MKSFTYRWRLGFARCLAGFVIALVGSTGLRSAEPPLAVRVMTFNLRFASDQPPNTWAVRRPVMRRAIEQAAPDVIGTQEGLYAQLRELATDLPQFEWIGLGREGGSRGEHTAIFYRRDRFEPTAYDHFWLSDTPEVIASITWGTHYHRMVTWVRLRERATGRQFEVWNTHFDHEVEEARVKSAELLRARLGRTPALPALLIGDFNCAAGASRPFEILTREAGLVDTWTIASRRVNESLNTFHNYEPPLHEGVRIDWILARTPVRVERAEIVTHHEGNQYPSDHFPVVAEVQW